MPTVRTTAELRDALERANLSGRVALHLPEGNVYLLNGTPLHISRIHVSLHSDGDGATLDAQGKSLHFETSLGGQLHLHRVHTRGGNAYVREGEPHDHGHHERK